MGKRVIFWQPKPQKQMRELERWLEETTGSKAAFFNFLDKMQPRLERIAEQPESGRPTGRPRIRYIKIDDYRSLFYRIRRDRIQIILLWDSRRDPSKNPYSRR